MKKRVLLYSHMHIPKHSVLCSNLINWEYLGGKLWLNNENSSSTAWKVLSTVRNSGGAGQRKLK